MSIQTAKQRMRQRTKLPTGDHILSILCKNCQTSILCWNNDYILTDRYPYRVLCTYCKEAEKSYNRAIFGTRKV